MGVNKTHEQFVEEVKSLVNDEYSVLGVYSGGRNKIELKHNKCGYVYEVRASAFLYGARCPKCARNIKKTTEEFKQEVFNLVGDEYEVVSDYVTTHIKVEFFHKKCEKKYKATPAHFLTSGRRCPYCHGGKRKEGNDFKIDVKEKTDGEYEVLSDYKNNRTPVEMIHNVCGTKWKIRPYNFNSGKRCPNCNQSHGEKSIERILKKNKIPFKIQWRFDDCKNERSLPFDFAILKDSKVIQLIEFQGEQHYRIVEHFGGKKGFLSRTKNDKIKKEYCKKNKIPLLIIDYHDNIEEKINTMTIMSQACTETTGRCND